MQLVQRVQALPEINQDKHGRSNLLSSYVSYVFTAPGSGTPIASPTDSPRKIIFKHLLIFISNAIFYSKLILNVKLFRGSFGTLSNISDGVFL